MLRFPVTKSFLAIDALALRLQAAYGLADVRCQLITATVRDVYLVLTAQQRFVFFVYRCGHRTLEQIESEWRLVAYLGAHGVPVAPAVRTTDGQLTIRFDAPEGTRYGVLTLFMAGHHLRQRSSAAAVRAYGRHVATIHTLTDAMPDAANRPIVDAALLLDQAVAAAQVAFFDRPDAVADLQACTTQLQTRLRSIIAHVPAQAPAYGMIHGDVIRANALVDDAGAVTVLDFDFCGWGWRAYDIASYLLTIRGTPDEAAFADAFLTGYTDVRALLPVEHRLIPLFEAVRAVFEIGTPAAYINDWGSAYVYTFLDQALEKLKHIMDQLA